jgi:CubicO group peptidase (beta-lactamase class C family)
LQFADLKFDTTQAAQAWVAVGVDFGFGRESAVKGVLMRFVALALLAFALLVRPAAHAEDNGEKLDRIFAEYTKPGSPGCALGVIRDGNFVYRKGYGMGSLELGVPLSAESVFYMGSVSKQFTAAAVVLAQEQGYLSLDDDVRKYIPEIPDYGHEVTLREMLHHTSGFRDFLTLIELEGRDAGEIHSEAELIDLIARQKKLNNVPGDEWIYSNTNYFLLGVVVKRATKKSLGEFTEENIFKPLGMTQTRFYDDHTLVLPGRVGAYDAGKNGTFLVDWSTGYDIVGAGGLMSTVDDLLAWDRNFYTNKLGKRTLVNELQTKGVLNDGKQISYALGLEVASYRGLPIVEHDGGLYGYRTNILRFPDQRLTVVCLCNLSRANPHELSRKVADVYLSKNLKSEVAAVESPNQRDFPDPNRFAGRYLDSRKKFVYSFTASQGSLMAWGAKLRRIGPNQFKDLGTGTITFEESDGVMRATLAMDGYAFFDGKRIEQPHLTDADLTAYSGIYRSSEIDATYRISAEKGGLSLRNDWESPMKLSPIAPDEFEGEDETTFVFERDENHRINGLSVFTVRTRGVSFSKAS